MPAVQLAQLDQQINSLTRHFADPESFRDALESLLVRYADLTYKPGESVRQSTLLISSYRTAPIVMRKLEQRMGLLAVHNPELVLPAADLLWQAEESEMRRLAAVLVGNLPADYAGEVLQRMREWSVPGSTPMYFEMLYDLGTVMLRRTAAQKWLELIRTWLSDADLETNRLGVIAITKLVNDREFENLPAVYNAVSPLLEVTPDKLQYELRMLVTQLAHRSPTETAYFLRQAMGSHPTPTLIRLVRRILPEFPVETQDRLKNLLTALPRDKREYND